MAGSQLPLLQTQAQPVSLAPPPPAGAPARSISLTAATGQAAAGTVSQALQSVANRSVPATFPAWPPAAGLLSTLGLLAAPGRLSRPSAAAPGVPLQLLHSSEAALPDAAVAGAAPQQAARSRQPEGQAHSGGPMSTADQAAQTAVGRGAGGIGNSALDQPAPQPPLGGVTAPPAAAEYPQVQCSGLCKCLLAWYASVLD